MKDRQIIAIGGGNWFPNDEAYLQYLREYKIESIKYFTGGYRNWMANLHQSLGESYTIIAPTMPSKKNAKYLPWAIWFGKLVPFLTDDAVLVGYSLGGCFLAKYLSQERLSNRVAATFLISAPFNNKPLSEFAVEGSLESFAEQAGKVFLYHSKDDPAVPFSELAKYEKCLPKATARVFEDRGHFNQSRFSELIEAIRAL